MQIITIWVWLSDHIYKAWEERKSWWRNSFYYLQTFTENVLCVMLFAWGQCHSGDKFKYLTPERDTLSGKTDYKEVKIYKVAEMSHT